MEARPGGLAGSLRNLAGSALGVAQTRLELLSVEFQEEVLRIEGMLVYGAAGVLLLGIAAAFLAAFLTVLFWDTHRLAALGAGAVVFLAAGAACTVLARSLAKRGSRLFASSLAELARDRDALNGGE